MTISLKEIDFYNCIHKAKLMKLAIDNCFYVDHIKTRCDNPLHEKITGNHHLIGYFIVNEYQVIGFVICSSPMEVWEFLKVNYFLIDKKYRNNGFGKQTMKLLELMNYPYILVDTDRKEHKFYEKIGYSQRLCFFADGLNLMYAKIL